MTPHWVPTPAVRAIHAQLLSEHGGLLGSPQEAALESTLARPLELLTYAAAPPSIFQLAAVYGFGLARDHCFADGNKRMALAIIDVFLQLNGFELMALEEDAVLTIRSVAAGELNEAELASWVQQNSVAI